MRYGDTGPDVEHVQVALGDARHDPGPVDGILGPRTWKAMQEYSSRFLLPWTPQIPQGVLEHLFGTAEVPVLTPTTPDGATFIALLAGDVAVYDVSKLLPRHATKRYAIRDPGQIEHVFFHHSGMDGAAGYPGMANSAKYSVSHHNWPGLAYHWWFSADPDYDSLGRSVIYRGNADETRCYHTGGEANTTGIGVVFQGNLTRKDPSRAQKRMFEAFTTWAIPFYSLQLPGGLSYHSESAQYGGSGKPSCPGYPVEELVKLRRTTV